MSMKQIIQKILGKSGYQLTKTRRLEDDSQLYRLNYPEDSIKRKAFYNISAGGHFGFGGSFFHPLWTNIDVDRKYDLTPMYNPECDIAYDPFDCKPLPIDDASAELFHSRFAMEHITDTHAEYLLRDIYRCLKKNGVVRFIIPNLELDYIAYKKQDYHYFSWIENFSRPEMMQLMKYRIPLNKASLQQVFLVHFAANASTIHADGIENPIEDTELDNIMRANPFETAMDLCTSRCSLEKQKIYRQNHINWWNYAKLGRFLRQAGFKTVHTLSPGQSLAPVMRNRNYFDWLWNDVALFMEAVK